MIYVIFIVFALISFGVQKTLQNKFENYSKVPIPNGLTGKDIAEKMLHDNLSHEVYHGNSVAAAAVAAHECGHAVQHATAYAFLNMRSKLVPIVSFASHWVQWVLLAGIILLQSFPQLMLFGIILFALTTLFSFVTLPVEINASARALAWLDRAGITNVSTHDKAKDALKWAAYTYVVAALSSLATLVYYILLFLGSRSDD